jgi:feruloyl esterase
MTKYVLVSLFIGSYGLLCRTASAHSDDSSPEARCHSLQREDFSRVPDALTQVIETKYIEQNADANGYCEVYGYVAPSFGFVLRLPSGNWNEKFLEVGCGGACGSLRTFMSYCDDPLNRGYACIGYDSGHRSTVHDVKWAYNDAQAPIDYSARAPHLAAIAGKAIISAFYTRPPQKSYFMGCSAGGLQAMRETQTFPWDFDGVIASSPSFRISSITLNAAWGIRALSDENGRALLAQKELETLNRSVIDHCDLNDGVKDGLIGDPRKCEFDPSALRCSGESEEGCLTSEQVSAVKKIYSGPVTSTGEQIALPAALKGSERNWLTNRFDPSARDPMSFYSYMQDWFRYTGFEPNPGLAWSLDDLDFDRDHRRLGIAQLSEEVSNPDLRRFKAAGGKFLAVTGWSDELGGVLDIVDYYETTEKIMGGREATRDFFRLFVVPGMNHCSGGDGAFFIDYLSYLEAWVEHGKAPEVLLGAHLTKASADRKYVFGRRGPLRANEVEFSRPTFPYPTEAKYVGSGNPKESANFVAIEP